MSWKFVLNGANMLGKTIYDIAKVAAGGKYEFLPLMEMFISWQVKKYIRHELK